MWKYWKTPRPFVRTEIAASSMKCTLPEITGYTGVPAGAAMSMPLWKRNVPGPCRPSVSMVLRNLVRGSPKFARIGCCWWNGLIGHG